MRWTGTEAQPIKERSCASPRIHEGVLHCGELKQLKKENKIVWQYESENADRCHVLLLDKYIQKLPAEAK